MIKKVSIKVGGNYSVPVEKRFLDVLALMRFGKLYEDEEVKVKTRALIRDLVGNVTKIHPRDINYIILKEVLPKSKAALLP